MSSTAQSEQQTLLDDARREVGSRYLDLEYALWQVGLELIEEDEAAEWGVRLLEGHPCVGDFSDTKERDIGKFIWLGIGNITSIVAKFVAIADIALDGHPPHQRKKTFRVIDDHGHETHHELSW